MREPTGCRSTAIPPRSWRRAPSRPWASCWKRFDAEPAGGSNAPRRFAIAGELLLDPRERTGLLQLVGQLEQRALVAEISGEVDPDRQSQAGAGQRQRHRRAARGVVQRRESDVGLEPIEQLVELQR